MPLWNLSGSFSLFLTFDGILAIDHDAFATHEFEGSNHGIEHVHARVAGLGRATDFLASQGLEKFNEDIAVAQTGKMTEVAVRQLSIEPVEVDHVGWVRGGEVGYRGGIGEVWA